jgi:benzoyl-CoA reductase/2-hydroxyglutaryl-CoA dehydratase subunit BcrC/BadD/HgdB
MPTRSQVVTEHRLGGGKIAAVFPGRYPSELLSAMNVLPVEVWDPPVPVGPSSAHLQPFACSVAQRALALFLAGAGGADFLLFPHLCDTIQNLFTIVRDCIGSKAPCLLFNLPRNPALADVREFIQSRLHRLAESLLAGGASMWTDASLEAAVREKAEADLFLRNLYQARSMGKLACSNREFYALVRSAEFTRPADLVKNGRLVADAWCGPARLAGKGVVLSGVLPDWQLLELLDRFQVRVLDDDLISAGRRFPRAALPPAPDPWAAMCERLLGLPPCSTQGARVADRVEFLGRLVKESAAKGVIFHTIKFCEPELFYHPHLVASLKEKGIPVLLLESELHQPGQDVLAARVEAFAEMLR